MYKKYFIALILIFTFIGYAYYQKNLISNLEVSEYTLTKLPLVSFKNLEGSLEQQTDPKPIVVHFWATWCGPCEVELKELLVFANTNPNLIFKLVAVNDEIPKIRKFISNLEYSSNPNIFWLIDNENSHRDYFGTAKLPETYLFGKDTKLVRKFSGPQPWLESYIADIFSQLP
jgi:cytochrome c biogenesis protein CcmG/thiol:disulfide interchange protein DsbE